MAALKSALLIISGVLFVFGFFPYIYAIWRDRKLSPGTPDKTEPRKASWIIWASLDWLTLFGMGNSGSVNGLIVGATVGATIVAVLAVYWGTSGWTWLDRFCLSGIALSIFLWWQFSDAVLVIVVNSFVMFIGSFPTFASTWYDPRKEDKTAWIIFWLSCVAAVIAIPVFTWQDASQPISFFFTETIMMFLLFIKPWIKNKPVRGNVETSSS